MRVAVAHALEYGQADSEVPHCCLFPAACLNTNNVSPIISIVHTKIKTRKFSRWSNVVRRIWSIPPQPRRRSTACHHDLQSELRRGGSPGGQCRHAVARRTCHQWYDGGYSDCVPHDSSPRNPSSERLWKEIPCACTK